MAALIEIVLICVIVAVITALVQERARWRRDEPADDAWLRQLRSYNYTGNHRRTP